MYGATRIFRENRAPTGDVMRVQPASDTDIAVGIEPGNKFRALVTEV